MATEISRPEADLSSSRWDEWIAEVCGLLGVDPDLVDVPLVHDLTKQIAHRYERPMAPVGSYILGIALGAALERGEQDPAAILREFADRIERTLPNG